MRPFAVVHRWCFAAFLLALPVAVCAAESAGPQTPEEAALKSIYSEALVRGRAYENLRELVAKYPGRLAGSKALEGAIAWTETALAAVKPDRVFLQDVMVPHWERGGPDSVMLVGASGAVPLSAAALGGSGASPREGLEAEVVEVHSIAELAKLGRARLEGRIVFFNRPMDPASVKPGPAYGGAGDQRMRGPAAAAKYGAAGALVRSLTQRVDDVPHTGVTIFPPETNRIPALALSLVAADRLSAAIAEAAGRGATVRVSVKSNARTLPDAPSHNVVGELRGREFPGEVIVVGGHIDSWDITPGAHDDGAGIVQSIEVLRILRAIGYQPRHTIRAVAFVNEENGTAGGKAYAKAAAAAGEKHLLAFESDAGGFEPRAISFANQAGDAGKRAERWLPLLRPYGICEIRNGAAGTDVSPMIALGVVAGETLNDSQRYFDVHHTTEDTIDKVNPRELELGAAAMAAVVWLVDQQGL